MRAWLLGGFFLVACGGKAPPTTTPMAATAEEQVKQGGELYGAHCAKCHGASGEGGEKAPPVVGQGVLPAEPRSGSKRTVQFNTAADVYAFVKRTMPGDDPGSLSDHEYLAILAFDLSANGVKLDKPLDEAGAQAIALH
jgi:mono/diheme cytochrome c family protein